MEGHGLGEAPITHTEAFQLEGTGPAILFP